MNYYDVLGIPKDCEQSLIEHIYKSLVKIYHPDVFKGDKSFAEDKLKAINLAYSELGNPDHRKIYDAELSHGQSAGSADEIYDDEWKEYDAFSEFIAQDWNVATDYFPNIDSFRKKLVKINKNLAFYFQIELIATKRFRNAEEIFLGIRKEYLNSKFGDDLDLHNLVLSAIETGNRRFAIDLNKALVVLGKDEFLVVLYRLIDRYPEFCRHNYIGKKFSPLLRQKKSMGLTPGKYRAGSKSFGVSPDYSVYIEGMHFNGVSFENFDSIESLVNSGRVSEQEVRGANKIF